MSPKLWLSVIRIPYWAKRNTLRKHVVATSEAVACYKRSVKYDTEKMLDFFIWKRSLYSMLPYPDIFVFVVLGKSNATNFSIN